MKTIDIVERLKEAAHAYYNGLELKMSDHEYDELVDHLRLTDPDNPYLKVIGAPAIGTVVKHDMPVGSQEKLKTKEEYDAWAEKISAMHQGDSPPIVIQWKLDGITVVLNYRDGHLVSAVTRGDGVQGEDITRNVVHMQNVPKEVPDNFTGSVRGEILLYKESFTKYFEPLGHSNPRNTAAGKARKKTVEPDLLQHLSVIAFDITSDDETEDERTVRLANYGFLPVGTQIPDYSKSDQDETIWECYERCAILRPDLGFEVDGVIVRANLIATQNELGMSSDMRPKGQRCIKFEALSKSTYVRDVEVTIGHTGAHVPTIKVEPVEIGGVTIGSILGNNYEYLGNLDVAIGDKIEVERAGDVIPHIKTVLERPDDRQPIVPPTECIHCGGPITKDGAYHLCTNVECEGREFRRLKSWVTKRQIKFLGDGLLAELYENHGVRLPADLYSLTEEYLQKVSRGGGVVGTGARHIMPEIEKSKTATLPQFLGSLAIRFLGRRQVEIMMKSCGLETLEDFLNVTVEELESKDGFSEGGSKAKGIVEGIQAARETIEGLLGAGISIDYTQPSATGGEGGKAQGKSFCFTGALPSGMKRKEAEEQAKSAGGEVRSVSKKLDYLVIADPSSNSSKAKKARDLGVTLISEEEFQEMIGG